MAGAVNCNNALQSAKIENSDLQLETTTDLKIRQNPSHLLNSDCAHCKQTILQKDSVVFFGGNLWHEKCVNCSKCNCKIGSKVFTHGELHYCRGCHLKGFVKDCARCGKPVIGHSRILQHKTYHPDCLICFKCHVPFPLRQDGVYTKEGKNYCKGCCIKTFGKTCGKCSREISPFDEHGRVIHNGRHYHNSCFVCSVCKNTFPEGEAVLSRKTNKDELFCLKCYDKSFGKICSFCKKMISALELSCSSGEHNWHNPSCLKCRECGAPLVGKKLFINDDGSLICSNSCQGANVKA